ncbi:TAF5-like RNA polymerase II p300/CBP-associated factor-associated factor 65 kDa subunit 5L isoform X2 [Chelonus insularis]|uniref:TAF5-like RNA polymerase II p300/CBP-associated factor-associated factor 65 kDa subunit 5L isoform X2 n=1 Tax=Chelonus insularis TaxID=460826 RepID=UPI001589CAD3|nr:TAF5-like RNA polymerase II p300/CBP-associated factor-associated factor 65 kDa subunit 5L isoform X2 [Chelonus insularis]
MKRSKIDIINATVESYLKRRRYQYDEFRKTDRNRSVTSEEMTLNEMAETGTSTKNSIIFSTIINDVVAANQAYQRFKDWINSIKNDDIKQQLKFMLYPVFCHLYLDIIYAGNLQAAIEFFKTYQKDFAADTEKNFLEELSNVFSVQDVEIRPLASAFRNRKYKVNMSDEAYIALQKYLGKHGHVIIMQIINIHIAIVRKISDYADENKTYNSSKWGSIGINGHTEQVSGTGIDREMRELQEAIRLLKNNPHKPLRILKVNNSTENASCARMTHNMDKIAVGFSSNEIRIWAMGDNVLMRPKLRSRSVILAPSITSSNQLSEENFEIEEAGSIILRGHTDVVHDLRFVCESQVLLSVSSDNDMRAWRTDDYTCSTIYSGHNYPIWCMDTSLFDLHIATGSHDRTAKLWSLDRKFPLRVFAGHFMDVNSVKFHPNARYIATGSADKSLRLWNKDDGKLLRSYVGAQSTIYSLVFSPDGRYLASAGEDKSVMIWDLATDALLNELKGHQATVMQLDWSPDGQFIASGSSDGVVRIWSTKTFVKTTSSGSSGPVSDTEIPTVQEFATSSSAILSLQFNPKTNSPICIVSS